MRRFKRIMCGVLSIAAQTLAAGDDNLLQEKPGAEAGTGGWSMDPPWGIDASGGKDSGRCARLDYAPELHHKTVLSGEAKVARDTYYRTSLWCRSDLRGAEGKEPAAFLFYAVRPTPPNHPVLTYAGYGCFPFWHRIVHYFNTGDCESVRMRFFPQGEATGGIWIDDLELRQLSDEDLQGNLLPNPAFEEGEDGGPPCMWTVRDNRGKESSSPPTVVALDASAGFIKGTKSLRVDGSTLPRSGGRQYGVYGIYVPSIPGKEYVFSVWMRAIIPDTTARLIVDGWLRRTVDGKEVTLPHWYKEKYVTLDPEWRRYSLAVSIPGPESKEHYLPGRLVKVHVQLVDKGAAYVDEMALRMR